MGRKLLLHHWYRNNCNSHHVQRYQSLIATSDGCTGHNSLYCIRKASYIPRMLLRNGEEVFVLFGFLVFGNFNSHLVTFVCLPWKTSRGCFGKRWEVWRLEQKVSGWFTAPLCMELEIPSENHSPNVESWNHGMVCIGNSTLRVFLCLIP